MTGRGRGATLPAWMTSQQLLGSQSNDVTSTGDQNGYNSHQFVDKQERQDTRENSKVSDVSHHSSRSEKGSSYEKDRRSKSRDRKHRKRSKSRSRSRSRDHKHRDRSDSRNRGGWRPKKDRGSNFDVRPPDGVVLPPIVGVAMGGDNSYQQGSAFGAGPRRDISPNTRHARRIYVGGIPPTTLEHELAGFFNDICIRGLPASVLPADGGPPVISVYLNLEKGFAFVELPSVEIATASMKLDGITFKHHSGVYTLRIKRPHDYKPEIVPPSGPITDFNLPEFNVVGNVVGDGPGKVFVGGLPYHLTEEQVKELLGAFGPLKAFNLVKDPATQMSKGYGFCEYFDPAVTQLAIQGLNDMPIGEKRLTVRIAEARVGGSSIPGQANPFAGPLSIPSINMSSQSTNPLFGQTPTRILRLENMVTSEELQDDEEYEDILSDVRDECRQYGTVETVLIPRAKSGFPQATEGFIFVVFSSVDGAIAAAQNLFGRKFADRTVIVNYFDELKFQNRVLF